MTVLTVLILLLIIPMSQELIHRFIPVGICVIFFELDINYGVSLVFL